MSETIKVLLVDDEPIARAELTRLLGFFDDVEIINEAIDAQDAIAKVKQQLPDLIFIDINMPEINGLALAEVLQQHDCALVFCTAYSEYAVDAFGLDALDYLTKPVSPKRLSQCLQKYRERFCQPLSAPQTSSTVEMDKPVLLKDGENMQLITPNQIERIESVGNYVKIKGQQLDMLVQNTLSHLETRLSKDYFIRANRQTIVNLQKVVKMEYSVSGGYLLTMLSGAEVEVSRRQGQVLKNLISL